MHCIVYTNFKMVFDCLILENDELINENCEMSLSKVTSPEAIYLDEGNCARATMEPEQKHVVPLNPLLTLVNFQLV